MLGRLALKMKELAEAELQYECHKNGNSALTNDLQKLRDGLEREVSVLLHRVTGVIELISPHNLSYVYSNKKLSVEDIDLNMRKDFG